MRPIVVVESQVPLQRAVELQTSSEVSPTKGHTPVLVKDRALQAFDEAVGPCVTGFRTCVTDTQALTGFIKRSFELASPIGQDSLKRPISRFVERQEDLHEETDSVLSGVGRDDACSRVRAGCIAGRDLPNFPHPFESTDVEGVQTDEFTRLVGFHMPPLATGALQFPSRALREQTGSLSTVSFQDDESLLPSSQIHASQRSIDRAGRQESVLSSQLQRIEARSAGGMRQCHRQNRLLVLDRQAVGTPPARRLTSWVKPISTVALISIFPAVEQGPGNPQLPTGCRDIAELPSSP